MSWPCQIIFNMLTNYYYSQLLIFLIVLKSNWSQSHYLPSYHNSLKQYRKETLLNCCIMWMVVIHIPDTLLYDSQFCNRVADKQQITASLLLCRPGQQYTAAHKTEVSHSEHQCHCPAITPPLIPTPHCVNMSVCHPSDSTLLTVSVRSTRSTGLSQK